MLTQSDLDRERYEARRKAEHDHISLVGWANRQREEGQQEGRQEGRTEGEKIGVIPLCERLLNRQETPTEKLATLSLEELTRLAEELQEQILKSRGAG